MPGIATLHPVSPQALAISHLFVALLLIMGGVFLLVAVWTLVNILRFRARPNSPDPQQYYGSSTVELAWTIPPALLLVVVFGMTIRTMGEADPPLFAAVSSPFIAQHSARPDIEVIGHQFFWEIRYPGTSVVTDNEIHLPAGRPMYVELRSVDVIHSLWIPQLAGKTDLVPGQINHMWLESDKVGTYDGQCAEFCGTAHAWMRMQVIVQTPVAYTAWLAQQAEPSLIPTSGAAQQGYQLFMSGTCRNCHAIAGTAAAADIGPNLTHFASRAILGGGVLTDTQQHVAQWLANPQVVKPGNDMPNFQLNARQVQLLTAYMETLR